MATAEFQWYGNEITPVLHQIIVKRLNDVGQYLQAKIRENLSATPGPSSPGDYPAEDTGRLKDSIIYTVDDVRFTLTVGTTSRYGLYLEFGTSGGKTLTAGPGQVFSWIDKTTGNRIYSRTIRLGSIKPRSFLRRTFNEEIDNINRMLTGTIAGKFGRPL